MFRISIFERRIFHAWLGAARGQAQAFLKGAWPGCLAALLLLGGCGKQPDRTALQEGLRALDGGHYARSVLLFQRAVQDTVSREDSARAYNGLGIACCRLQQTDQAVRAFENAARMDPGLVDPVYNLGALHSAGGRATEAVACFEKAALIDPRETRALEFLAVLYLQRRQGDDARRVLTEARARAPRSARVLTRLALLELQANNLEQAVVLLQEALEHDHRYPPALFNLALINGRRLNNPEQAREHFQDYLRLVPEGPQADQARRWLKEQAASAAAPVPAGSAAPPASAAGPALPPPPTADELMETAKKLARLGRREAAVNTYVKAARAAERAGSPAVRERALQNAGAVCADDARANYELGRYYAEHQQNAQAVIYLKPAVNLATNWLEAEFALARAAQAIEEFDTARLLMKQADQRQAGQAQPDPAETLWDLASFCEQSSMPDLAVAFYVRLARQHPEHARAGAARERLAELAPDALPPAGEPPGAARPGATTIPSWWGWLKR